MSSFFFFVPIIGIPAAFLYVVYRVVDLWVKESLAIRREQNTPLAKLIEALDEKNNKSDAD